MHPLQGQDPVSPLEPRVTSPSCVSIHLLMTILKIHIFCTKWHLQPTSTQSSSDILISCLSPHLSVERYAARALWSSLLFSPSSVPMLPTLLWYPWPERCFIRGCVLTPRYQTLSHSRKRPLLPNLHWTTTTQHSLNTLQLFPIWSHMHGRGGEQQWRKLQVLVLLLLHRVKDAHPRTATGEHLVYYHVLAQAFAPFCHVLGEVINKTFPCICILCPLNLPLHASWANISTCEQSRSPHVPEQTRTSP